ncbi:MBL fold metallo-hydrolase [Bosea sp. (in: a-proteobacteria)]|jgi:glyoxylase-like metal-dependent hydrolase (beta-lactamase superfamily II)|uniref:MBL fold metallo-hydrolase n=1 Tax=Bosea sp. (in: a-proteobacteria) TaxID=1871050 RepID=UPI002DDD32CB|nr:MBL fold metallo-hydrolase [Bosea sp. (in: a-proteobacteria)]HEV2512064.1 MBL fold metallo-hydrolase [Bosea sp. (in: a-proteobacteria)]
MSEMSLRGAILPYLSEPEPERGLASEVAPGIRRIVAPNAGLMTYHGTNTYLIEAAEGMVVLDPGPDDAAHVEAILAATGGQVVAILLSHSHPDHLGAVAALKARTGATTFAFHRSAEPAFQPDVPLKDGCPAVGMVCLHTPGHASDHLCFARPDGVLFSADHVMTWSSSVVSPPGGDMAAYFASLRRLLARQDRLLLPGHGPPLSDPAPYIQELLDYRIKREEAIAEALREAPVAPRDLVDRLYSQTHPWLRQAAERNVTAHLLKLQAEGRAEPQGKGWISRDGASADQAR